MFRKMSFRKTSDLLATNVSRLKRSADKKAQNCLNRKTLLKVQKEIANANKILAKQPN